MTETPLEHFGRGASKLDNFAEIAGRYRFQKKAEQHLLCHLFHTLSLSPDDDVLDIGCGAGNLLIPISFFVHSITGVDHSNLLAQIKKRVPLDHDTITLVPGDFSTTKVPGTFSRILIYSVIHYLRDEEEMLAFIRKAATLLRPGGKMIIGDIPNKDMKTRFLSSEKGKAFALKWQKKIAQENKKNSAVQSSFAPLENVPLVAIDDMLIEKILKMLNRLSLHARRVAEPETLAFCFTREDIIVERD